MHPLTYIRCRIFNISQLAMAEIAEVNQATVSRWETGAAEPGRSEMERIRSEAKRRGIRWHDKWFFETVR